MMILLDQARERLGLTPEQLSRQAGISPSTYSRAVRNLSQPTSRTLKKLELALARADRGRRRRERFVAALGGVDREASA